MNVTFVYELISFFTIFLQNHSKGAVTVGASEYWHLVMPEVLQIMPVVI